MISGKLPVGRGQPVCSLVGIDSRMNLPECRCRSAVLSAKIFVDTADGHLKIIRRRQDEDDRHRYVAWLLVALLRAVDHQQQPTKSDHR
jgi:hypothetical protein